MEYHIQNNDLIALQLSVATEDVCEIESRNDDFDDVLDELNNMQINEFKQKYPNLYDKYYVDKCIKGTHITIKYRYPLIAPIKKIYKSDNGF